MRTTIAATWAGTAIARQSLADDLPMVPVAP
jgi:hypothetical protein